MSKRFKSFVTSIAVKALLMCKKTGLQELWWKRCMDEQSSLWLKISGLLRFARNDGHCEERSDEAIQKSDH